MQQRAFIASCAGGALRADERSFFKDASPCGLILFKRNCESPAQIRALIAGFQAILGLDRALILIDQEGGRVQRLAPPHWRRYPPARVFGLAYARDPEQGLAAAYAAARLIARDLHGLGITVNCAPVLDIPIPAAHDIIGDRAYSARPEAVAALGRAVARGYLDGGVLPVIKHMPGHGRAGADSHLSLPVVDASLAELMQTDFRPFQALSDMPLAMTAHVLFPAIDAQAPASASSAVIKDVIRGIIGFQGLLMSDDLEMGALQGGMEERTRAVLSAGCDLGLHCSGKLRHMEAVAKAAPLLSGVSAGRYRKAMDQLHDPEEFDAAAAAALLSEVLAQAA